MSAAAVDPHARPVRLGAAGVEVTQLGLGTGPLGGMFEQVGDAAAADVVRAAFAAGIRYVDTAPLYGLGLSERRVGAALAGEPRPSFALSTKVGRLLRPVGAVGSERHEPGMWPEAPELTTVLDYSGDGVRRSLEESLGRLGLDRVDVAYVHDPDDHMDKAVREAAPALEGLRDEGVIRAFGFGMNHPGPLLRVVRETGADCVLVAGRYTLLDQSATGLLEACAEHGVGVVVGGVFNSGILAAPRPGATFDYRPASAALVERSAAVAAVCDRHGVPLGAAALQFPLAHPAIGCVLAGVRSAAELAQAVDWFDLPLPADLWRELAQERLLPEDVPLP